MATVSEKKGSQKGISGSTLKIIAMLFMLVDHTAAVIMDRMLIANGYLDVMSDTDALTQFLADNKTLYIVELVCRGLGRISFPLFCFLLIEGFLHTHDVKKYAINLGIFALISEVPFDLAFKGSYLDLSYQNIFFTLLIGLVMMIGLQEVDKRTKNQMGWSNAISKSLIMFAAAMVAFLLQTDYGAGGIVCIAIMYYLRSRKEFSLGVGCCVLTFMSLSEIPAFLALIPAHFYNGERGLKLKYVFYAFYPVHLLILYGIACAMGLGQVTMF